MANSHHRENEVPWTSMALIKKAVKRVLERVVFITSKREENNLPRKEGSGLVLFCGCAFRSNKSSLRRFLRPSHGNHFIVIGNFLLENVTKRVF